MAIASHPFYGIILFSMIVLTTLEDCPAKINMPKFYKTSINIAVMISDRAPPSSPRHSLRYVHNYPNDLLDRTSPANIASTISVQKIDAENIFLSIGFKVSKFQSETKLLITLEYFDSLWKNFDIGILLLDKPTYPNLAFGEITIQNSEGRLESSIPARLPSAFKQVKIKTLTFMTGVMCFRKQQSNYLFEINLADKVDTNINQITFTVKMGDNTILTEINLAYIVYSDTKNYEISGTYITLQNVGDGVHSRYLGDKVSSQKYFLTGISSFKFKKGPGSLYLHFKPKLNAQNLLELKLSDPVTILKLAVFRVGNLASKLCETCPQKTVFNTAPATTCVSACPASVIQDSSAQVSKCLICPTQLNYQEISGKCSCPPQFTQTNGRCILTAQLRFINGDSGATFSRSDSDCVDPNSFKGADGICVCKPSYQMNSFRLCQEICKGGLYDGQTCKTCEAGTYPRNEIQACIRCSDFCLTCSSEYACGQCEQGFQRNAYDQCEQICGDGIRINAECDDRNNADGDGCSSNCKIESGFNCRYEPREGRSICFSLTYTVTRKDIVFTSGNLIIDYEMWPAPTRQYSQDEVQKIVKLRYLASPPYQTSIYHIPTNLSLFRIVGIYGGSAPIGEVSIEVQIEEPNGVSFRDLVKKSFAPESRMFSRRGNPAV